MSVKLLIGVGCLWAAAGWGIAGGSDLGKGKAAQEPGVPVAAEKGQPAKPTSTGGNYIRYTEQGKEAKLETAIAHFVRDRDGATVDLIAVVHVADQAYYDELDNRMVIYDAVLYEMVGGPYNKAVEEDARAEGSPLQGLAMIHGVIQSLLKLEYQKDGIDYLRKNFVHADVDWEKFQSLSAERNQTIASWFERAMNLAGSENLPGMPKDEKESRVVLSSLLGAVINGDAAALKRTLAPILSEAETLISRMEGKDGTVLVTERNKVALEVLREQLRFGKRKLAVLYGGGHMPDLEKRLIGLGFHKAKTEWISAWDIRDDPAAGKANILADWLKDERIGGLLDAALKLLDQTRAKALEKSQ
jgi:hypothetical protein